MDDSLIPNIELFIAQVPPFNHLPPALIKRIAKNITIRYIPKGDIIVGEVRSENEYLYIVRTGAVEQIHQSGRLSGQLRAKLESGDSFGFGIFDSREQDRYKAYALENSLIYQVSFRLLNDILTEYPEYAAYFSTDPGTRLHHIAQNKLLKNQNDIFIKRVADVANPKIAQIEYHATIRQAAQKMCEQRRSSALIMHGKQLVGIITDRDMTKKVVARGLDVNTPVTQIMTPDPPLINGNELVLNAVSMMMQHNIRSLPVMVDGQIRSILTATDLVKYNSIQSVFMINHIFQANKLSLLTDIAAQQKDLFGALMESGTRDNDIMQVMTLIADAFNRKLLMMAEHCLGPAPCAYAWVVAGSQARYEMHLLSDQDNALIVARELNADERHYFARLARFVNDGLNQCGYAHCSGGYMASNPRWCQSLAQWKSCFSQWVLNPESESLLNASVLMDMRGIYGDVALVNELQQHFTGLVAENKRFLAYLVANSIRVRPPLSIFRNFVLTKEGKHKNKLNLKKRAISLLVDLGRIYALAAGISETMSTEQRFIHCQQRGLINQQTMDNALGAYGCVCNMRFKYQWHALQHRQAVHNHIDPRELNAFERNHLKDAFRLIAQFQEAADIRFSQRGIIR